MFFYEQGQIPPPNMEKLVFNAQHDSVLKLLLSDKQKLNDHSALFFPLSTVVGSLLKGAM